jgi:hypothetical protein
LAKPNYEFAKRQRDLAKKRKKEEKKLRKAGPADAPEGTAADSTSDTPAGIAPLPPTDDTTTSA